MVHRPEWMTAPVDEDILLAIKNNGNLTPKAMDEEFTDHRADWISTRCQVLVEKGFLRQLGHGLYGITDLGESWIDREITLDDLEDRGLA